MQQVKWLIRAWSKGPGRTAFREVYPSYVVLLLVVCVVFGGNGLQPRTVVRFATTTPSGGMLLLCAWVMLSSRAYRAARSDPAWQLLRTFPLSLGAIASVGLGFVLLVESPWLALWATGGGMGYALIAVGASLVLSCVWIQATGGARVRFLPHDVFQRSFALSMLTWLRTLVRQYTLALVGGMLVWACVTAVILAMLKRPHEIAETKRDFGVGVSSFFLLLTATTLRWLIHQNEHKAHWVFGSCEGGKRLMVWGPVATVLSVSLVFCLGACGIAVFVAGAEHAPLGTVALPLGSMTACFGFGFGLLAVALQGRWLGGTRPLDALVKALVLVVPTLLFALQRSTATAAVLAVLGGVTGVVLLRRQVSGKVPHNGEV